MKKIAFALFAVLALCASADATGCVVRNRVVVAHQAAAVVAVTPVVAAVFAPVVAVPAYSVGYSSSNLAEENERLKLEIKVQKLELQIQKLQSAPQSPQPQIQPVAPPTPTPQAQTSEHPAIGIMRRNCASCHDNAVAKGKGGGFAMTDGQAFAKLTDRQALSVAREVYSGRMPKSSKLTDEEVGQIMSWLDTQK
jgi:mono/diheme cytochrome c family protein